MKSVFLKYICVFASVLLVSFLMLTSIIATTLGNYYEQEVKRELERMTEVLSYIISSDWESESQAQDQFGQLIDKVGTGFLPEYAEVFFTTTDGKILGASEDLGGQATVERKAVEELLRETDHIYEGFSDLGGVLHHKHQVYGRAVYRGDSPVALVFAYSNGKEASTLFQTMNRATFMSSLWVMLAALVVVYFVSDRMVRPLKSMSSAVKNFARGNFEERIVVTGRDEIAELANGFNQMADALAETEQMRNSFLANLSHDLRTPMTAIAGFIDGINSGAIPPEKQEYYLNIISAEIHRLSRLVTQILDISRLASGERKFTFAKCDLCETARLVIISFEQKIEAKQLDVEFDADEENLYALADADAVHQVIYNLCENAIKFSNQGGCLRITLKKDKHFVTCRVYNEGVGIPGEDLPYIFDRFYKSDKSRGLDKSGVGLGLYIVKSIVDAHEGKIVAHSDEGKNCEFAVSFPEYI